MSWLACGGSSPSASEQHDAGAGDASADVLASDTSADVTASDGSERDSMNDAEAGTRIDATMKMDAGAEASRPDASVVALTLGGCYANLYTAPVTLGGTQPFQLTLDTGSTTLAVAEEGCSTCEDAGISSLYAPGSSATDLKLAVSSQYDGPGCCQTVSPDYGWTGDVMGDSVTLAGMTTQVDFAAMQTIGGGFLTIGSPNSAASCDTPSGSAPSTTAGIVGFGPDSLLVEGTTGFWDGVVAAGVEPDIFAVKLCHSGGTLWLGGVDPTVLDGPLQYTTMSTTFGYTVAWTGVSIEGGGLDAGVATPFTNPGAQSTIIDSGGNVLFLPTTEFTAVATAIEESAAFQTSFGASWLTTTAQQFSNCVTLDELPAQVDAELPTLTVILGAINPIAVPLTATQSYLSYRYVSSTQVSYCQNMLDGEPEQGGSFYLGLMLMLEHVLVYDRANLRFGVAPSSCPF